MIIKPIIITLIFFIAAIKSIALKFMRNYLGGSLTQDGFESEAAKTNKLHRDY